MEKQRTGKGLPEYLIFLSPLLQALRFAWLLTLHPARAGRTYAAYVVFIFSRLRWLWPVDGVRPTAWDVAGSPVAIAGMAIIMFALATGLGTATGGLAG